MNYITYKTVTEKASSYETRPHLDGSQKVAQYIAPYFEDVLELQEKFVIITLDRHNKPKSVHTCFLGGISECVVDVRIIFKHALDVLASGLILIHNHPSGNLQPSTADINITKKLKEIGVLLNIPVLDHLILSYKGYFSFADECMM